jgi:hypothetical protein
VGLYQILNGVVETKELVIRPPSLSILTKAEALYESKWDEAYESGLFTEDELKLFIIENAILPSDYEHQIVILRKHIGKAKEEYYNNFVRVKDRDRIRSNIQDYEYSLLLVLSKIGKYSHLTCDGYAEMCKSLFLIENSTFYKNGDLYDFKTKTIVDIQNLIEKFRVDDEEIREISLSNEWRTLWSIKDTVNIFSCKAYELTNEQKSLIYWTKFYDTVFQNPDCPSEEVIKDHYAIDGWYAQIGKKEEQGDKYGTAGEVFIKATSSEDLARINNLNSDRAKKEKEKIFERR